ncbi:hypothetical protein OTU49_009674, partial [Cherax quadricarinatus]
MEDDVMMPDDLVEEDLLTHMNWPDLDLDDIKDLGLDWSESDVLSHGGVGSSTNPVLGSTPVNTSTPTHNTSCFNTTLNSNLIGSSFLNSSDCFLNSSGFQ